MDKNTPTEKTYSVKEAATIIGIKERAVQFRCKRDNIRKKSNRYLITDTIIASWKAREDAANAKQTQNATQQNINSFEKYTIKEIENTDFNFDGEKGNLVFVPKDKVYAEYTNEEYSFMEQRLNEWYSLQKDIEHKDELFDSKEKSLTELLDHYKNQFEYQKQQSTKILDMHQKLIDTIEKQSAITIQRNIIEANEKDIINEEWKTNKQTE
jgi:hypothetical protein